MTNKPNFVKMLSIMMLALFIAACTSQTPVELPTAVPLAQLPTQAPPTNTPLPPTRDLAARETPLPTPTTGPQKPTVTPTPVDNNITITIPNKNALVKVETEIDVRGLAERAPDTTVWVSLISKTGRLLVEIQATASNIGWETTFTVPPFVTGDADLIAAIRSPEGDVLAEDRLPVTLIFNEATTERFLQMDRPVRGETAVSGYYLFFDGTVFQATNNTLTISVWANNCQERIARQTYTLGRSNQPFYWSGFLVMPRSASGPACAVAYFGEPGTDTYREAQVAINIVPPEEDGAKGVTISSPAPGSTVTAGQELVVFGTALNASDAEISVGVASENGRVLGQSTVTTDYWGYWEARFTLPFDAEGPAKVTVIVGQPGDKNHASNEAIFTIEPAPTPTPAP